MAPQSLATGAADGAIVDTAAGRLRGVREGEVLAFHAVPYAAPPVGPLRFAPPAPAQPWSGVRDATRPGPSAPQNASRLDAVMGIAQFERSEDCLFLDIWTPAADAARRPVLVWLHGGAYMSGGGNQAFYTGGRLAARGDIVVVSVTYRLGALGYLYLPGIEAQGGAPANRGLLDQVAALRWIRDNIAAFGGDPENVTVSGQSAGAGSVLGILARPDGAGLVRRAIAQSGPGRSHTEAEGREVARIFFEKAGLAQGDVAALRAMEVPRILAAQGAVVMDYATRPGRTIPWQPVAGTESLAEIPIEAAAAGASPGVPMMLGWTRDEMHAWYAQDDRLMAAGSVAALKAFPVGANLTEADAAVLERRVAEGLKPWEALAELHTVQVFGVAATSVADRRAAAGCETYVYRFDWTPAPDARFRACHCIEIPFMFDNFADWPPSPMLEGANPASLRRVTDAVQAAWIGFVREGRPGGGALPDWPRRSATRRAMMIFDDTTRLDG